MVQSLSGAAHEERARMCAQIFFKLITIPNDDYFLVTQHNLDEDRDAPLAYLEVNDYFNRLFSLLFCNVRRYQT